MLTHSDSRRALVIVDCQVDFCEGGALPVAGGTAVARAVARHLHEHHDRYAAVVATRDWHIDPGDHFADDPDFVHTWPAHCVAGTSGAAFSPALEAHGPFLEHVTTVVSKGLHEAAYSGFEGAAGDGRTLEQVLRETGVDTIEVCGLATDHCVRATALDGVRAGFTVHLLPALCAGVAEVTTQQALSEMHDAGVLIDT